MNFDAWLDGIRFDERGLVPVLVRDAARGAVLTLAWANREALLKTRETGMSHFFSRSRQQLWKKGETSGHVQRVLRMTRDCDQDAVLYDVEPTGPACHTGAESCFYDEPVQIAESAGGSISFLHQLYDLVEARKRDMPEGSYTTSLFQKGAPKIAQKVGEEGVEVVVAALAQNRERVVEESADLLYHLMVLWAQQGVKPADVMRVLEGRHAGAKEPR